jgi:hypothetical protein
MPIIRINPLSMMVQNKLKPTFILSILATTIFLINIGKVITNNQFSKNMQPAHTMLSTSIQQILK